MARLENGKWASSRLKNQMLIVVLEASSRNPLRSWSGK